MAKKDTIAALTKRGINEDIAAHLVNKLGSMAAISEQGVEGLVAIGLTEESANDVIAAIGKRHSRPSAAKKSEKAEEDAPAEAPVQFEEVPFQREHPETEMEKKLKALAAEEGVDNLPLKIFVDLAKKIEPADPPISDDKCRQLIKRASEMFEDHRMDQNESAGIMAAHSIGEPGTQMNLRTFHFAGDSFVSVTRGLPRLIEIVDARATPSTPSMTVPLLGLAREDEGLAKRIASNIEITTLSNIAEIETDVTNLRLIIKPNPELLEDKGISFDEIVDRLNKIKAVKGLVKAGLTRQFEIVVESDPNEPSFKKLQQMYDAVRNAKIKGIDGIKQAFIKKDDDEGTPVYTIITDGSNLKEILKVDMVDAANVKTNSICEIASVLGIEAARNAIVEEAYGTLEDAGLNVDIRHIMMVADVMTNDGAVRSIGRNGISGKKSSVLARAAFEITTAHLLHAAIVGEVDGLEGVTENIIVGQPVTLGTGAVNLKYTPKKKGENE